MEQDKIWEIYQNDPEFDAIGCRSGGRIEYVAKNIPADHKICVLNIGVGKGSLERILLSKGVNVFSLDPSETSIAALRKQLGMKKEQAKTGYSQRIPYPDSCFDYVVMTEVLEHLDDNVLRKTLVEVRRVLKPAGIFVGTVPADESLSTGLVVCPHCGTKFHRWGHLQSFSRSRLVEVLGKNFSSVVVKRKYFQDYSQLNWKGKLVGVIKGIQALLNAKGSNQNFYFEAR